MNKHWIDTSPGWILPYEEAFLEAMARTLREGASAVNIGGAVGTSSAAILRGTEHLGMFRLLSIDIEDCPIERETVFEQGLTKVGGRFTQAIGDSVDIGKALDPGLDLVFIDGSHDGKHVLQDLKTYAKLLNPNGLLICHDYNDPRQPQVTEAIEKWRNYKRGGGKDWLKIGYAIYTVCFMKPGEMDWAKGRLK